jgi:hypothetical protein
MAHRVAIGDRAVLVDDPASEITRTKRGESVAGADIVTIAADAAPDFRRLRLTAK